MSLKGEGHWVPDAYTHVVHILKTYKSRKTYLFVEGEREEGILLFLL